MKTFIIERRKLPPKPAVKNYVLHIQRIEGKDRVVPKSNLSRPDTESFVLNPRLVSPVYRYAK